MDTQNFNLSDYLSDKRAILEAHLNKILFCFDQNRELIQAMRHSLMAGGKRLRPILSMASAQAVGQDFRLTLPAACAIEMIHTYSLIHDDLPAMDNDDIRRGVPTCHKAFSEATAILAGDALLTHAFKILSKPEKIREQPNNEPVFKTIPEKSILIELISIISDAAGVDGMVEGQMIDMMGSSFVSPLPSSFSKLDHLKKLHHLKTGRMIIASVQSGALSVGVALDSDIMQLFTIYAENIGLAFQVTDDILNVEGDPDLMGKAVGSDQLNDKLTFPTLLGVDKSKEFATKLIEEAVESLFMLPQNFQEPAIPLKAIAQYIIKRKK